MSCVLKREAIMLKVRELVHFFGSMFSSVGIQNRRIRDHFFCNQYGSGQYDVESVLECGYYITDSKT